VVVVSVVDNAALGRALGAFDYFVKPVDGKALLSRLSQYTFTHKAKSEPVRACLSWMTSRPTWTYWKLS